MSFDIIAYSKAFEEFLAEMVNIPDANHPGIHNALHKTAELLRVSTVTTLLTEPPRGKGEPINHSTFFYQNGEPDPERKAAFDFITPMGGKVVYTFVQLKGGGDWTQTEREKLGMLAKMLFVFNGRARVMRIAEYMTYHDKDTDMYNLNYFMKCTGDIIAQGKIGEYTGVYLNLKNFSQINKIAGRKKGTEIITEYISALASVFGEDGIAARIGGDNFVLLFKKPYTDEVLKIISGKGIEYNAETHEKILVSATAGCYDILAEKVHSPTDIMDRLGMAVNIARTVLKEQIVFYDSSMAKQVRDSKEIENMFPEAIKNKEFQVYYQPKISLRDYKLAGAEALCRWFHKGEMIMPYRFIPVLEQTHAITVLDFYMLDQVCKDIKGWLNEGSPVVKISVNISRRHLGDMNLLDKIINIIDSNGVPHEYIEIELTETTTDVDFKDLKEIVTGLQSHGISTSVDDFGVGYSSLNLIRELPWDVLKIDKSFIDDETTEKDTHAKTMLKHTIAMAQEMSMECIVEGVETAEQVQLLKDNNCFLAQGFFFDKPLPKPEFEKRLDSLR